MPLGAYSVASGPGGIGFQEADDGAVVHRAQGVGLGRQRPARRRPLERDLPTGALGQPHVPRGAERDGLQGEILARHGATIARVRVA